MQTVYANGHAGGFTQDSLLSFGDNDSVRIAHPKEKDSQSQVAASDGKKPRFGGKAQMSQRSMSNYSDLNYSKRTSTRRYL
jgi:hypothetical protein